ncbi:E3 ubiquitin-protein ligase Mdm2 isoform X1 [Callorhinchus milii]|uniref:MDM2 proto-onco n=1 Tax=Callorhinchus milii TaxID=7868 RepID=A0A4W3K6J0_CALMI|nr:E3 ubiquitin-protein ligase Mdm2 isoform X1 [Callorhinchus milii]|eukprot:gi/632970922/ref/XP_007901916.1/ PREDICTED: E3 ubiquitin-protein ligase Mdm2 [Callorhinchus milii]
MARNGPTACFSTSNEQQLLASEQESQVRPKPLLLKLLQFAGAQNEIFTIKEVMYYLGQYIMAKHLYDEKQQHVVHCSDNPLGRLFGVQSFSIKEPRTLYTMLSKNLIPLNPEDSASHLPLMKEINCELESEDYLRVRSNEGTECTSCDVSPLHTSGRKSTYYDSDNDVPSVEQPYTGRRKRHRSDSISLHWDDLSLYLISKLRREHENCDSSDSCSNADVDAGTDGEDSSDKFSVEFEVESIHSEDYSEHSQELSDEEVYEVTIYEAAGSDEDSYNDDIDPEISAADYWKCENCGELNPPLPRYCHRCWFLRRDWLPDKPKRQTCNTDPLIEQDEGIDVPDCKKPSLETNESYCSESQETESSQPSVSSSFINSSQETEENAEKGEKGESNNSGPVEPCVICQTRPKNGCIVHGKTGHLLACYTCAKKLKRRNKPCPLCREPIQMVVLTYFS